MSGPECATFLKQPSRTLPHDKRALGWNHPAFGGRVNSPTSLLVRRSALRVSAFSDEMMKFLCSSPEFSQR